MISLALTLVIFAFLFYIGVLFLGMIAETLSSSNPVAEEERSEPHPIQPVASSSKVTLLGLFEALIFIIVLIAIGILFKMMSK